MNRHFTFKLKDEVVRGMTRKQYKAASHWVRWWAWKVSQMINWDKFNRHITDTFIYGHSEIAYEDMIK